MTRAFGSPMTGARGGDRRTAQRVPRQDRWSSHAEHVHPLARSIAVCTSAAAANGWAADDLERYRAHPQLVALGEKSADKNLGRPELIEISRSMPPNWLPSSSAVGTAPQCATRLEEYLDAGASEIILHGSTAEHLGSLVGAVEELAGR